MKDSRKVHTITIIVHASIVAIALTAFFYAPFCQAKSETERFGPIDSSLIILEIPKNPCEYAEPFFIYTGIRNPFSDTVWIADQGGNDELEFLDLEGNLLEMREQEGRESWRMEELRWPIYYSIAPGDTFHRNFDLCYSSHREKSRTLLPWSHLELPAFRVGKFRLRITYELFVGKRYRGDASLGKVSRTVDLEVLEPSPERQRCIDLAQDGLFDINVEGIDHYFTLRDSIENTCPGSSILQSLDVAFHRALESYLDSKWFHKQPVSFDLSKVETVLLDVARRYRRTDIGRGVLRDLYGVYRAQNARDRGVRVFDSLAQEYPNLIFGVKAEFLKTAKENNWMDTSKEWMKYERRHKRAQ
ncbi:hypothetical protein KKG05_02465 [bacterium]|nr:hypothetical protein [bacterium]